MQTSFSCFIVDDDELARLKVITFLKNHPFLNIEGVFDNAEKALKAAQIKRPDVLLLDIDMPGLSGLELREKLLDVPACIFITSYPDYALEGFEKEALDFLIKPVSEKRFAIAMERLKDYLTLQEKASQYDGATQNDSIFIKDGYDKVKIQVDEIIYLEALKDYTRIVTAAKKHCVLSILGNLLKEKPFDSFIRIHRSYAVPKNTIARVTASEVVVSNNIALPLGRSYKQALKEL